MPDVRIYVALPSSVRVIECSPPSWAARIVLAEKSVAAEVVELDFARGEHKAPEVLALNPRGTIPILKHGERVVHETLAILEYIERAFPEPPLLPRELDDLATALTRLHESAALKDAGMALFAHLMRTPAEDRDPSHVAKLASALAAELDFWDAHVPSSCESVTLADVIVFTYAATAEHLGLDFRRWPALAAFVELMGRRPSVRATRPGGWTKRRDDLASVRIPALP